MDLFHNLKKKKKKKRFEIESANILITYLQVGLHLMILFKSV